MMKRHRTISSKFTDASRPDIRQMEGVVASQILNAMRLASAQLSQHGIRHALAGALAVGAYGYPRATKDVDFLVGEEAFQHHTGGIVTISPGVPISVGEVAVDPMSIAAGEEHLDRAVTEALMSESIPVLPIGALVYLKLKSPRRKDSADLVELVKAGIPIDVVNDYLSRFAPHMQAKFNEIISTAEAEADDE